MTRLSSRFQDSPAIAPPPTRPVAALLPMGIPCARSFHPCNAATRHETAPREVRMGDAGIVTLFDVDNTLLDNDRVIADLMRYLERALGKERQARYWALFEELRAQ